MGERASRVVDRRVPLHSRYRFLRRYKWYLALKARGGRHRTGYRRHQSRVLFDDHKLNMTLE